MAIPEELIPDRQQQALKKFKVINYPLFHNKTRENINAYEAASGFMISPAMKAKITALDQYLADNMQTTAPGIIADEISLKTAEIKVDIQTRHQDTIRETQDRINTLQNDIDLEPDTANKKRLQAELDKANAELKKLTEAFTTLEKNFATDLGTAHQAAANHQAWINGIASLRASEDYRKTLDTPLGIANSTDISLGRGPLEIDMDFNGIRQGYQNPMGGKTTLTWDEETGELTDFTIRAPSPFQTKDDAKKLLSLIDDYADKIPVINVMSYILKIPIEGASSVLPPVTSGFLKGMGTIIDDIRGVSNYQRKCFEHETCALTGVMLRQGQEKISFTIASDKQYIMDDRARSQILGALKAGADLDKITIKTANPEYGRKKDAKEYITKPAREYFSSGKMADMLERKNEQYAIVRQQIRALRAPQTEAAKATLEGLRQEKLNSRKSEKETEEEKESPAAKRPRHS